jgi:hypothetical protein
MEVLEPSTVVPDESVDGRFALSGAGFVIRKTGLKHFIDS